MNRAHAPLPAAPWTELIRRVPKAEMHLHLEGALRWETVRELHPKGARLPPSPPWLDTAQGFSSFDDFRDLFIRILQPATGTPEAIERHTREVLLDLAAQNVRYAEVIIGLGFHTAQGLEPEAILHAMERGKRAAEAGGVLRSRFIYGLNRNYPAARQAGQFVRALEFAGPCGSGLLAGVDLQGDDRLGIPPEFVASFQLANKNGLRLRAHAGELAGAQSVRVVIEELGVTHISHGVRIFEDPNLVRWIAERGTYLHTCPTSNLRLGVAKSYAEHPLRALYEAGCNVTLNSDDPLLFGTTITREYLHAVHAMGIPLAGLARIVQNAFAGSLLDEADRCALQTEVGAVLGRT